MSDIRLLRTKAFRQRLYGNLQRGPVDLVVCVPFIGRIPGFRNIYSLARYFKQQGGQRFRLITGPPVDAKAKTNDRGGLSEQLAGQLVRLEFFDLYIRKSPFLHAKLYHLRFDDGSGVAYIGSSNLTKGGLQDNDEVMGEIVRPAEEKRVAAQLRLLEGQGAISYQIWRYQTIGRNPNA